MVGAEHNVVLDQSTSLPADLLFMPRTSSVQVVSLSSALRRIMSNQAAGSSSPGDGGVVTSSLYINIFSQFQLRYGVCDDPDPSSITQQLLRCQVVRLAS